LGDDGELAVVLGGAMGSFPSLILLAVEERREDERVVSEGESCWGG
jgi:hypothetical protein